MNYYYNKLREELLWRGAPNHSAFLIIIFIRNITIMGYQTIIFIMGYQNLYDHDNDS